MNPPPTPPEEGSQCRARLPSSPPGRGQGWVGSWKTSFRFCARIETINRPLTPSLSPNGGEGGRRSGEGTVGGKGGIHRPFFSTKGARSPIVHPSCFLVARLPNFLVVFNSGPFLPSLPESYVPPK